MAVTFKFADDVSAETMRAVLGRLAQAGLSAAPMFPGQSRPALARVHVVRAPSATVERIEALLAGDRGSIDYVEGPPERRPA